MLNPSYHNGISQDDHDYVVRRVSPRPAALGLNVILGCARMWTERSILIYTQAR